MKFRVMMVMLLTLMMLCACDTNTDGNTERNDNQSNPLTVSEVVFDSVTYALSAKVNAADGTEIELTCNGKTQTVNAVKGSIAVVFDTPFYSRVKGGKNYDVTFRAKQGYSGSVVKSIGYWPQAKVMVMSKEVVTVYCGAAKDVIMPSFGINYEDNTYTYEMTFTVYDAEEAELPVDTSAWEMTDLLEYLSKPENDGHSVKIQYKAIPSCPNGAELYDKGYVTYICKNDVLVKSIYILPEYGAYKALLSSEDYMPNETEVGDSAGGDISYKWYISEDKVKNNGDVPDTSSMKWNVIPDADKHIYNIVKSDIGKLLKVEITQTYQGEVQDSIVSSEMYVTNSIIDTNLYYDGIVTVGEEFDASKVKGTATDVLGIVHDVSDFILVINDRTADYSRYFEAALSNNEIDLTLGYFWATVQSRMNKQDEVYLTKNVWTVTKSKVRFDTYNSAVEYSADAGLTYSGITLDEFDAQVGDDIYIRVAAIGSPKQNGYLAASDPVIFKVTEDVIGTKVELTGGGITVEIKELELTLSKSEQGNNIIIKASLQNFNYDAYQTDLENGYIWLINGVSAEEVTYASLVSDSVYLDKTKMAVGETYNISLMLSVYTMFEDLQIVYARESSQIDVTVE
ncbi:MAG: hypothetical protein IKN25_09670 [Spirochaetales bacterium]|nr:hypothetical protein [Spirochaetales bacterium]